MNGNLNTIREEGLRALTRELGAAGTANFLRQFEDGSGDYTQERAELLDSATVDEIAARIKNRKSVK
jgi:hypothetical protein